jgi:hypothetical protein
VGLVGVLRTAAQNAPKAQKLPQLSGFESGIYMVPCSRRERYVYRKFGKVFDNFLLSECLEHLRYLYRI